jgi:hypothetical protein
MPSKDAESEFRRPEANSLIAAALDENATKSVSDNNKTARIRLPLEAFNLLLRFRAM